MISTTPPAISLGEFLRSYPLRAPHLMWLLGAGASANAGIPTAWEMIWEFKRLIYCTEQRISAARCHDISDERTRRRIQQFFDQHPGGAYPAEEDVREYEFYFAKAWPQESDRRRYIDSATSIARESFGHLGLAALLKCDRARVVWTTNFDHLLEDACAKVFGTTRTLTHANLDNPHVAISALAQGRWPILVKLHGDFRSDRLKNIAPELLRQDALLRRALLASCSSSGLVVVGYSGRDPSVMDALLEALADGAGYPQGLFWMHRRGSAILPTVQKLLTSAKECGVSASLVEIESFDELIADLLAADAKIDEETRQVILPRRARLSQHAVPVPMGEFPVIRTNALPIVSFPTTCRLIECGIGGSTEVREVMRSVEGDAVAVRSRAGVLAFGTDEVLRRAFHPFDIQRFDLYGITMEQLRRPASQRTLLYEALARALTRALPLRHVRRGSQHFLIVGGQREKEARLQPIVGVAKDVFGSIPGTGLSWTEAVGLRLEHAGGQIWLMLEPTVLASKLPEEHSSSLQQRRMEFVRERLATRFNSRWNDLLDAWIAVLSGGAKEWKVETFGLTTGVDAQFEISSTTGFSRRRRG